MSEWPAVVRAVVDQVGQVVLLPDHLAELLAWFPRKFFPHVEVIGIQCIDHLSSDDETSSANKVLADGVGVVAPRLAILANIVGVLAAVFVVFVVFVDGVSARIAVRAVGTGRQTRERLGVQLTGAALRTAIVASLDAEKVDDNVSPENQVACSIEGELRVATEHHLRIERLLDSLARKIGVLVVSEAPERNACILREVLVRGPQRDELCERASLTC